MWKSIALAALCAAPDASQFGLTVGGSEVRPSPQLAPPAPAGTCAAKQSPDRACTADSDCTIVRPTVSCCGTIRVAGINRSDVERFQAQERSCNPGRRCGCAPGPTRLDDGTRLERNGKVAVACRQQRCTTFLEPVPAATRLTSQSVRSLPACPNAACGPAPAYPTWECSDGVSVAGRGPCVEINGRCGWAHLECP